jgi:ATP-dependent Clp protease adapter protein ClpS
MFWNGFGLNHAQAFEIMLTVHKKGLAVVGVFSHEIASKMAQVMDFAPASAAMHNGKKNN